MGWIARVKVPPVPNLVTSSSKGVGARGQKAEKQKCAPYPKAGILLHPIEALRPHGTQVTPRPYWPESLGSRRPPVRDVAVPEIFCELFTRRHVAGHT